MNPWINFMLAANDKVIPPPRPMQPQQPTTPIAEGLQKGLQKTQTNPFGKPGSNAKVQSQRSVRGTRIPDESFDFGGDYGFAPPVQQPMGALPAPGWQGVVGNQFNPVY